MLLSMALTSFLTGVTEPIEFSFMFLAPLLYLVHALLTGTAMVVMSLLHARLGFSFSAGLFDYVLNFKNAEHPLYLAPIGAAYFALYYVLFRWCIVRFNLRTPGRDVDEQAPPAAGLRAADSSQASRFVAALGGATNLRSVDACTTRLRLSVADAARIDEPALRRLGAAGMVRLSANDVQVVLGPIADQVAGDIRAELSVGSPAGTASAAKERLACTPGDALLAALGGAANVRACELGGGRVLVRLADAGALDRAALGALGVRAIAEPAPGSVHLLHPDPASLTRPPS